jgi:hypothetical protein
MPPSLAAAAALQPLSPARCVRCRAARAPRRAHCSAPRAAQQPAPDAAAEAPPSLPARRALLRATAAATLLHAASALAAELPPPAVGDCADCIGPVNGALAACPLSSASCVSTYSDDEAHFSAPWVLPEPRDAALAELVRVACGGEYEAGFTAQPFGRERTEVASFILASTAAFVARAPMPPRPPLARARAGEKRAFSGRLDATSPGYLRIVFGDSEGVSENTPVYDAEFSFPEGDELCAVRFASRSPAGAGEARGLALSLTDGFVLQQNGARLLAEDLRKALRWELAPVITGFDPRFNNSAELWVEKPFNALRAAGRAARGGGGS